MIEFKYFDEFSWSKNNWLGCSSCPSSVWILFARFAEPSVFRMVEVSPRVLGFSFVIDRWITFRISVWGFFLGNKYFSRFYGALHFISLKNRSYVIIHIFIFFIFNFNLWYTSKWFFCNVNISTFLFRSAEIVDFPVTGRTVDVDAWSRPAVVKYVFELSLWLLPDVFGLPPDILAFYLYRDMCAIFVLAIFLFSTIDTSYYFFFQLINKIFLAHNIEVKRSPRNYFLLFSLHCSV